MASLLQLLGLALTAVGAAFAAKHLVIFPSTARRLAGVWDGNKAFEDALMAQSRKAAVGLALVVGGALLQFIGTAMIVVWSD